MTPGLAYIIIIVAAKSNKPTEEPNKKSINSQFVVTYNFAKNCAAQQLFAGTTTTWMWNITSTLKQTIFKKPKCQALKSK